MYGDKWAGKINYASGSFGLNNTDGNYLQLPTFSEEIDRVEITVSSISATRKLFLTDSSTGQIGSAYQSVSASETGTYTLDVSSLHLHTACLRVTSGSVGISKVAVIAKNDSRVALEAPSNVKASLDEHVNNTVHISWTGTESAAAYLLAYTPEGGSTSYVTVPDDHITLEALDYSTSYSYSVTALSNPYFDKSSEATAGTAFATGAQPSGMKIDVITVAQTAATTTSYAEFSGLALTSSARYAGKNAKGSSVIQLNSTNPYGIWSTTSGGYVRSVTVTLLAGTANTLDVYAKNAAYASGDIYSKTAATQGTKVGSITASTTESVRQKIVISDDYNYIGIRSNSGAIYVAEIRIEWATAGMPKAAVTTSPATDIEAVNATLNGSYSNAANGILEAGFYWDTNSSDLNNLARFTVLVGTDYLLRKGLCGRVRFFHADLRGALWRHRQLYHACQSCVYARRLAGNAFLYR